ncbi:MAG: LysR family transcriptional regulator [Ilumatobacteraceae bacterium]
MQDVTLKQLRSLAATVRAGTLAGAAQLLQVTAPAVAQQLRLLERRVGMALLERTADGARPTDAGRELLGATERIESELQSCTGTLELLRTGKVGSINFGAVSTAKYFAPQILASFWGSHADVDVKLFIGNRDETIEGIASHRLDLAIMGRPPSDLDLDTTVIGDHPHVVIASPRHPLAGRRRIAQRNLTHETFLVREHGSGTRLLTDWLFATAGVQPRIGMEILSNETIKQAVIADLGIAFISAHTVAAELADARLVVLDVVGLPVVRQWFVVRRNSRRLGPAGQAFWDFLGAHAAAHLPTLTGAGNVMQR